MNDNDHLAGLRASLSHIVRLYLPEDIVQILSEVMDDEATRVARRTGNYTLAGELSLAAGFLTGALAKLENYDPTPD